MAVQTYNLGTVTAYGDAKAGGYTGTLAEWQALMASYATVGQQAVQGAQTATTKAEEALTSAESAEIAKIAAETAQQAAEAAAEEVMAALITDSASGGIAHFVDGADNVSLKSLKVNIEPVQSGSGDPSPTNIRPITGWRAVKVTRAGENLCNILDSTGVYSGITYTALNGVLTVDGTATANVYRGTVSIPLKAGTYTATNIEKTDNADAYILVSDVSTNTSSWGTLANLQDGEDHTFTIDHDITAAVRVVVRNGKTVSNKVFKPMLVCGTEAPIEFESYNEYVYNVLLSEGENHFDINSVYADESKFTIVGDSVSGTATDFASTSFTIPSELVGNTLRFSIYAEVGETPNYIRVSATVAGLTYRGESIEANTSGISSVLFTPTSTDDEVKIVYGSSGTGVITVSKIRLEVANFVYGGTLDVVSGVLTVDRASVVMDGSSDEGWYAMTTANIFRANAITPTPASGATAEDFANHPIVSNCTNTSRYNYNSMKASYPCVSLNEQGMLYLAISNDVTTAEQATTWLAQNNLQIVYYLANPQTYQLTPQQVTSLLGINNIWSDVGDVDVKYRADTKFYIDSTNLSVDTTLSISGKAADAKKTGDEISSLKEDFNDLDSRVEALEDDVITTLLGDTPVTLTEDTEVRLTSAGQTEYTLSGIFLADYNSNDEDAEVRLNNTTLTKQGGKMIFTATGDSAETVGQCYADLRLNNLTVGDTYTLTITRGEYISGTTGGYFVIYDRNGEELARPGEITQDVVSVNFVATTTFARVRLQPTTSYAWETYDIRTATIVNAVVSSRRSASFNGSVNLGTLESGITISSTPTCQVYSLTRDTDTGSRLAGKVCVVLGDSVAAFRTPPEDIPSIIGQQTGMTVYNCAFGGCRISDNVVAQGDTDPWEAFCLVRLTDAITSGNWAYQDAQIQSLAELDSDGYSPTDHYATLKAVDWSNVDFLIIHFAGNDPGSARFDDPNDDDNTYYYLGAFRYSIRKLLTAYPHLKLLVVGTDYHKTGGSNTDDREYTMDGQTYHYYDWSDRLMAECKNFHIPTLDWYRSNGLNSLTVDYYMTSDGKHPNLIGNQLLGGQIAAKMLSQY